MIGLLRSMEWETLKGPLFFVTGMFVGFMIVAITWYIIQVRKVAEEKRQAENATSEGESEGDVGDDETGPSAIIVQDPAGDYLFEDKSQLAQIIDFKKVPRQETDRQSARRDLVITMLIAESMSK